MLLWGEHNGIGEEIAVLILDVEAGARRRGVSPGRSKLVSHGRGEGDALLGKGWGWAPQIEQTEPPVPRSNPEREDLVAP